MTSVFLNEYVSAFKSNALSESKQAKFDALRTQMAKFTTDVVKGTDVAILTILYLQKLLKQKGDVRIRTNTTDIVIEKDLLNWTLDLDEIPISNSNDGGEAKRNELEAKLLKIQGELEGYSPRVRNYLSARRNEYIGKMKIFAEYKSHFDNIQEKLNEQNKAKRLRTMKEAILNSNDANDEIEQVYLSVKGKKRKSSYTVCLPSSPTPADDDDDDIDEWMPENTDTSAEIINDATPTLLPSTYSSLSTPLTPILAPNAFPSPFVPSSTPQKNNTPLPTPQKNNTPLSTPQKNNTPLPTPQKTIHHHTKPTPKPITLASHTVFTATTTPKPTILTPTSSTTSTSASAPISSPTSSLLNQFNSMAVS
eukprot:TRINITY_DN142_c0_g1_i1.p1 TRINITY_DN142_c0_g1~~TRINITY_DN142_c0_g1_i1.p1  ORF type:complete len:385 (-),score=64.22 TRINITY_DN142_c0_g1_i1:87-1181(-)